MNYKTAMAAVFGKYRNPRTRSAAMALLERYSVATRPVTAWNALGEDADAARLLLEGLGFREGEHYTVQTSALDPSASRIGWTDAGLALVGTMAGELAGIDLQLAQRRVLVKGLGDPLAVLSDLAGPEVVRVQAGPGFVDRVIDATKAVARRMSGVFGPGDLPVQDREVQGAARWARNYLDETAFCDKGRSPIAPLGVLETLARLENVEGLPAFRVFTAIDAWAYSTSWMCSRAVETGSSANIPSGRVNCMPLHEQKGACGALDGFFAWNVEEFRRFAPGADAVWTQFDAMLCRTAEALNFALDANRMRLFVLKLLDNGYGRTAGLGAALSDTTRLAVGNTACGGVPGNEDLTDEDGDDTSFSCRVDDSVFPLDAPVYMGAFVLSTCAPREDAAWNPPTRPVRIAPGEDAVSEKDAQGEGLCAHEAAAEWFLMVHGSGPVVWHRFDPAYEPDDTRRSRRIDNLAHFRASVSALQDGRVMSLACSPDNTAYLRADEFSSFTCEGAFVQGLCAAMRKFAPTGALRFVRGSPHHPDKFVAGVWSGLSTDLAPAEVGEAEVEGVFPNVGCLGFGAYEDEDAAKAATSDLLDMLRRNPGVQLRFGKRTKGTHRSHVILIETNVEARPFVEAMRDRAGQLKEAAWRAFYTSFVMRNPMPLASVDEAFGAFGISGRELGAFKDWAAKEVPDWVPAVSAIQNVRVPENLFRVGWREDRLGRLVVVISTCDSNLALAAKLAYRYAAALPLPTAAYLIAHGRSSTVVLRDGMSESDRYKAVLKAALASPGFLHNCVSTDSMCGRFGSAWIRDLVWDMDSDELPCREWYLAPGAMEHAGLYFRPDMPF